MYVCICNGVTDRDIVLARKISELAAAAGHAATTEHTIVDLGLDRPVIVQYLDYLAGVVTGDFGRSIVFRVPVVGLVFDRIGPTLFLLGYGLSRAALETVREPDYGMPDFPFGLTMGMMLSIPMILGGLWLIRQAWKTPVSAPS